MRTKASLLDGEHRFRLEAVQNGLHVFFRLTVEEFFAGTVDKTEIKPTRIVRPDSDLFAIALSPECDCRERGGTVVHRLGFFHFLREWEALERLN